MNSTVMNTNKRIQLHNERNILLCVPRIGMSSYANLKILQALHDANTNVFVIDSKGEFKKIN